MLNLNSSVVGAGSKRFQYCLPDCLKLLPFPQEPKLAAELGGMRQASQRRLPAPELCWITGQGWMKPEESLFPSIPSPSGGCSTHAALCVPRLGEV